MFTKPAAILAQEVWGVLHSETRDGIISTRKWTHPPKTGYAVDTKRLHTEGFLSVEQILNWVTEHRAAIDYVPNAYIGAHRSLGLGDTLFEIRVFGSFPQAEEFAREQGANYIYKIEDTPALIEAATNNDLPVEWI